MSSAALSIKHCLYSGSALASWVAINLVPIYAKSAPSIFAAATEEPSLIDPERIIAPSNHSLTSLTKAKGESVPAWPPAPAHTRIKPSTPCSAAFLACLTLITS